MAFKKIRDLDAFDSTTPFDTSDFLAVANANGTTTHKITAADLVSAVNVQNAQTAAAAADTVTDTSGNSVNNPEKSTTEIIDPATGDIIDATPVTASNLDTLVDPGSGLEVIEVCRDANYNIVDCTSNLVKYRTKKLSLATSTESRTINITVDATDPDAITYQDGINVGSNGYLNSVFTRVRDAYTWIRQNVVDEGATINIYLLSDTNEGLISNSSAFMASKNHKTPGPIVNVWSWSPAGDTYSHGLQPRKIYGENQGLTVGSNVMYWHTASRTTYHHCHFVCDVTKSGGLHAVFRAGGQGQDLKFYTCKFTFCGGTHIGFEASRGATLEFDHLTDGSYSNYLESWNRVNPLDKQFPAPCAEFDFVKKDNTWVTGDGDAMYFTYFFAGDNGGTIRIPEYGPSTLNHTLGGPTQYTLVRFHFASSDFKIGRSVFSFESNCLLDMHANWTQTNNLNMTTTQFPAFVTANAYNSLQIRNGREADNVDYYSYPGGRFHSQSESGGVTAEYNQFGAIAKVDIDYKSTIDFTNSVYDPSLNLRKFVKWYAKSSTNSTNKVLITSNLTNYWEQIPRASGNFTP